MQISYLGLGSSLGDRFRNLRQALSRLESLEPHVSVIKTSSIYESPHLGLDSRDEELYPAHLNMVVKILTDLSPVALLTEARKIENAGGRERKIRWGPRTIDIDILLYGSDVIDTEALVVPHAGMRHRAFVIVPLWEIEPDLRFPDGASIKELRSSSEIRSQRIKRV